MEEYTAVYIQEACDGCSTYDVHNNTCTHSLAYSLDITCTKVLTTERQAGLTKRVGAVPEQCINSAKGSIGSYSICTIGIDPAMHKQVGESIHA